MYAYIAEWLSIVESQNGVSLAKISHAATGVNLNQCLCAILRILTTRVLISKPHTQLKFCTIQA